MNTAEILRAAAARVRHHWLQMGRGSDEDGDCASNTISNIAGLPYCEAHTVLERLISPNRTLQDVFRWNDAEGQTRENVAATLEYAALVWEQEQAAKQPEAFVGQTPDEGNFLRVVWPRPCADGTLYAAAEAEPARVPLRCSVPGSLGMALTGLPQPVEMMWQSDPLAGTMWQTFELSLVKSAEGVIVPDDVIVSRYLWRYPDGTSAGEIATTVKTPEAREVR